MLGRVFLGRYETIRLLGEGGMGRVYLARQADLGRQVVIKVMHDHVAADPTFRERFQRETLLMARFQHPGAVTLYDAALNDPGACIVMEFIPGETLDVVLARNRRLDPARVGRLLYQFCEVLQAAHNEAIIHRDLKPANLMIVEPDTPYERVKVMDFGLAKLLGPEAFANVTNHEFAVGTPGYMCPEQARGEDMDHRGDLYSVGVILFELLTGQLPFAGKTTMDVLLAHATVEPPSFATAGAAGLVPEPIERVVQMCLSKNPNHRPRHARELWELYRDALENGGKAEPELESKVPSAPRSKWLRTAKLAPQAAHQPAAQPAVAALPLPAAPLPAPPLPGLPEPVLVKSQTPPPPHQVLDPLAVVHHLEAWMPEKIATYKMRGFIQDVGGELVENVPGRISVRLGGRGCNYLAPSRGWFGLGRRPLIDMELRLQRGDNGKDNQLRITVVFRSQGSDLNTDPAWRALCTQIYCDLRAYLMGANNGLLGPGT